MDTTIEFRVEGSGLGSQLSPTINLRAKSRVASKQRLGFRNFSRASGICTDGKRVLC